MRQFSFRRKVLLLAVALVMAMQLVTLFPVLNAIRADVDERTQKTVGLAGVLFDEYIHNRNEQLLTTVNALVSDFGFKQAVATGEDHATIRSALLNQAWPVPEDLRTVLLCRNRDSHIEKPWSRFLKAKESSSIKKLLRAGLPPPNQRSRKTCRLRLQKPP